ncbi:putative lipid II flippase FtsW [sulfur-oxidizing endosymbiont of Gigantopelta aegis]|uniref:putative lipid II flippase FtsW n=1 Tax=sulfur-oxidizing endosymbiont of Gigantopelta aegis TaxID=2794934 RepID=UPI001FEAD794|nr:putative lipid II flippase FtsW [sulfur-oxidizing endosymbiont of Gigantopelta aegis]
MPVKITVNNGRRDHSNDPSLTDMFQQSAEKRNQQSVKISVKKTVKEPLKKAVKKKSSKKVAVTISQHIENQKWLLDPWVLLISITIISLGIIMVGSASISIAERNNGEPFYYLYRQLIAAGLGLGIGTAVLFTPMKFWQSIGPIILLIGLMLLIAVLIPGIGREINGSSRWIPMGVFNLQVSELIKLAMVIYLAGYMVRHNENVRKTIKGFFMPMMVLAGVAVLLLLEPDLGVTVVISATALGMLFLGGVRLWQFIILILLLAFCFYWLIVLEPYRMERLQSFMNPWADPFDSGFQLTQSLIAFGRGELTGVGLGNSIQKLFYLPEGHTDFLFAVLAEELGAVGAISVIALFSALVSRIFVLARKADLAKQTFSAYVMFGLAIWIGLQAFVNIAVNMGVLPTKGLTLPMMSYGGSSMMIMCVVIALVLRAEHETRFKYPLGSFIWDKKNWQHARTLHVKSQLKSRMAF